MDGNELADPGMGNPPEAPGATEKTTGDIFEGLFQDASSKGSSPAPNPNPPRGKTGTEQEPAPAAEPPLADDPGLVSVAPWRKQLKADLQVDPRLDRFNEGGIDATARAYLELEGKLGVAIIPPGKDAKPEEWTSFFKKLGRPDKPENYALGDVPIPEGMEPDEKSMGEFKNLAFGLGLSNAQAKRLYETTMSRASTMMQGHQAAVKAKEIACQDALKEAWRGKYDENLELARRVVKAHGSETLLSEVKAAGLNSSAEFMKFIAKIGQEMREDSLVGGSASSPAGDGFDYPGLE